MIEQANLSIDLRKSRIRIHKAMLHKLGDPQFIQLLVNPSAMEVAIRSVDVLGTGEPVHKITEKRLRSDNSYEIYSRSFLLKLSELVSAIDEAGSYRMSGKVLPAQGMAVFYLDTLQRIDTQGCL